MKGKRKGFTLVELLIVIVVIGVLSTMMMLSSTEAVTSAKASNIVSNLRNLKTAALALYVDSLDTWNTETAGTTTHLTIDAVKNYLNDGSSIYNSAGYSITSVGEENQKIAEANWYIIYNVSEDKVRTKLRGRASSVGLLEPSQYGTYTGGNQVAIKVR